MVSKNISRFSSTTLTDHRQIATDTHPESPCTPIMPVTVVETMPAGYLEHFKGDSANYDTDLTDNVERAVSTFAEELDMAFAFTALNLSL